MEAKGIEAEHAVFIVRTTDANAAEKARALWSAGYGVLFYGDEAALRIPAVAKLGQVLAAAGRKQFNEMLRQSGVMRPLNEIFSADSLLLNQVIAQLIADLLTTRSTRASA